MSLRADAKRLHDLAFIESLRYSEFSHATWQSLVPRGVDLHRILFSDWESLWRDVQERMPWWRVLASALLWLAERWPGACRSENILPGPSTDCLERRRVYTHAGRRVVYRDEVNADARKWTEMFWIDVLV